MKIYEKLEIHNTLNRKLFSEDNKLYPIVRQKIFDIVEKFIEYSELDINVADIQIVGSNASFNYTTDSDLDVHIISNFELINAPKELLQALYNAKKTQFNDKFNITIRGIKVEMYVQDVNDGIASNGIYSVVNDDWIKFPKQIEDVTSYDFSDEISTWSSFINSLLEKNNYDQIVKTINQIYMIRHNGLAIDGEYGKGNQLFKELRSAGLLDKLKDSLNDLLSNRLSLEELNKAQILNKDF